MPALRSNFTHLREHDEQLLRVGMLAEKCFAEDPNTCLLKLRQLAELLAQMVASFVGLLDRPEQGQFELLGRLRDQGIVPREIHQLFTEVRIAGNDANHKLKGDHKTALTVLKLAWQISVWFSRAQAHLYIKDIKRLPVPLPPPDEQAEIVRRVEALFALADRIEARLTAARAQVERPAPRHPPQSLPRRPRPPRPQRRTCLQAAGADEKGRGRAQSSAQEVTLAHRQDSPTIPIPMARKKELPTLQVSQLGPIKSANIDFGDLTVLVGPQASGKSVLLQTLKLMLDHRSVSGTLRREGYDWQGKSDRFAELFFGEGMENLWTAKTQVKWNEKAVTLSSLAANKVRAESKASLFYIPAHRVVTLKNGWPRHFGDYSPGDPYVVQDFSERLRMLMETGLGRTGAIFPQTGRLTEATRTLLKRGIFGDFELKQELSGLQKRLVLQRGAEKSLPFMVWSAGQREFSPLLLGLYHLMPAGKVSRRKGVDWVVLEEPEMGLHPRAITAVLFLVLELLHRGYRVCLSTHSPHVLDLLWALRVLIEKKAEPEWVLKLFNVGNLPKNKEIAASVLTKVIKVHYLDREEPSAQDISRLDPDSESAHETNWGGLTEFSAKTADVIADFVANHP